MLAHEPCPGAPAAPPLADATVCSAALAARVRRSTGPLRTDASPGEAGCATGAASVAAAAGSAAAAGAAPAGGSEGHQARRRASSVLLADGWEASTEGAAACRKQPTPEAKAPQVRAPACTCPTHAFPQAPKHPRLSPSTHPQRPGHQGQPPKDPQTGAPARRCSTQKRQKVPRAAPGAAPPPAACPGDPTEPPPARLPPSRRPPQPPAPPPRSAGREGFFCGRTRAG